MCPTCIRPRQGPASDEACPAPTLPPRSVLGGLRERAIGATNLGGNHRRQAARAPIARRRPGRYCHQASVRGWRRKRGLIARVPREPIPRFLPPRGAHDRSLDRNHGARARDGSLHQRSGRASQHGPGRHVIAPSAAPGEEEVDPCRGVLSQPSARHPPSPSGLGSARGCDRRVGEAMAIASRMD
jgi:hypothetical protein